MMKRLTFCLSIALNFSVNPVEANAFEEISDCINKIDTNSADLNDLTANQKNQAVQAFCNAITGQSLNPKRLLIDKLDEQKFKYKGLTLKFKAFESDNEPNFGIEYDYSLSRTFGNSSKNLSCNDNGSPENCASHFRTSGSVDFQSKGTFAFEDSNNPLNMIDTKLSLTGHLGYFSGESLKHNDEFKRRSRKAIEDYTENGEIPFSEYAKNIVGRNPLNTYREALGVTFIASASADIGYETDQTFSASQFTYGGSIYASLNDYRQDSNLKWFNIVDYPAAIVRFMTGLDDDLNPRGTQFPFFRFAVAQVDPDDQAPRFLLAGDGSNYTRINFEASYSAPLFKLPTFGLDALKKYSDDTVFLTANYRYYRELSPSDAVRAANLTDQRLWTVSLTGLFGGMYVSYSNGELPLDVDRDNVVELGFKTHF
jgi:hypothetical protein